MSDLSTGNVAKGLNDLVSMIQADLAAAERLLSTAGANAVDGVRAILNRTGTNVAGIHHIHNNPGKPLPASLGGPVSPTPTVAAPPTPAPVVNPVVNPIVPPQTILPPTPPATPTTKP